jgi:hypothetical protein
MEYTIIPAGGEEIRVEPGSPIALAQGQDYVLRMEYYEDHRNCTAKPEETLLLLDGSRWRENRDDQPLVLSSSPVWTKPKSRTNVGELAFTAAAPGSFRLEIIRECTRDGYQGELLFVVS